MEILKNLAGIVGNVLLSGIVLVLIVVFLLILKYIIDKYQNAKKSGKIKALNLCIKIFYGIAIAFNMMIISVSNISNIVSSIMVADFFSVCLSILIYVLSMVVATLTAILLESLLFIPYLVAHHKNHRNKTAIFVLNLLGGFVITWIAALVWACTNPQSNNISMADELKKYKELADSGVISEDEFEEKKKELLK